MKTIEVLMLKGLMGSGKTTFAKQFLKENQNYKCVNRDALRHMLSNYTFNSENEKLVQQLWLASVESIISQGYNLIVDETNLNPKTYKQNIDAITVIAKEYEIPVSFSMKEFDVYLEEAILRDKLRDFSVGEDVIRQAYKKYILPEKRQGVIDSIIKSTKQIKAMDKPLCIIYDLDGTTALNPGHRSYYDDTSAVLLDTPNQLLQWVFSSLSICVQIHYVAVSGRKDTCYRETRQWLDKYKFPCNSLYMRKSEDSRQDSIIKKEIYEEHIKDKYDVLCVFDDRPQVLKMWTELGLYTFNVNQDPYCSLGY